MTSDDPADADVATEHDYLPTESQLTLFCLEYLRDLRRTYSDPQDLVDAEGLHADWLTLAIYALGRSFSMQGPLKSGREKNNEEDVPVNYNQVIMPVFNDSWIDSHRVLMEASPAEQEEMMNPQGSPPEDMSNLPSLQDMTNQILLSENPFIDENEKDEEKDGSNPNGCLDSYTWYEYDDAHPSNANRFFLLNGLSGSVNGRGPLLLGEVAAAGLLKLKAKARLVAEDEMVRTPLFEQFVHAVESKGFFEDPEHETPQDDPQQEEERLVLQKAVHDERMGKVVSKFRSKLASKIELPGVGGDDPTNQDVMTNGALTYLADYHHGRRMKRVVHARKQRLKDNKSPAPIPSAPIVPGSSTICPLVRSSPSSTESESQAEAESLKSQGNAHMQKKKYKAALECYTQSLKLCPSGPQSHVYFSNRAAALLSMKMFDQAILDSERALSLAPTYGKAHARLGLAHFLLGDYRRAMEAYTVALKYEPDNRSSKSYLEKAAKKLAAAGQPDVPDTTTQSSYSVVSEWDKSNNNKRWGGKSPNPNSGDSVASNTSPRKDKKINQNKKKRAPGLPSVSNEDAENQKTLGNTQMANREYQSALESYSSAIGLSPNGPQSHVYYSNRAAALCYLERYEEAVKDSESAIALKPTYGKAHARLGLSRFFMNNLEGSIAAYKTALSYDPNNAASKSYLTKAQLKLERQRQEEFNSTNESKRLMEDPDMIHLARKMINNTNGSAANISEEEQKKMARKAMADPTMLKAIRNIQHVDPNSFR